MTHWQTLELSTEVDNYSGIKLLQNTSQLKELTISPLNYHQIKEL